MHNVEQRKQTHEVLLHLERLLSDLKDAETGQRGYVITGKKMYLQQLESSRRRP